jgi:hypothetical protein
MFALRAYLVVEPTRARRPEELRADGTIVNEGDTPVEIDPAPLSSPSLAIEITDRSGQPVPLPPPPVPRAPEPPVRLAPEQQYGFSFPGFVPGWIEPGVYRARVRYIANGETVVSDWREFALA